MDRHLLYMGQNQRLYNDNDHFNPFEQIKREQIPKIGLDSDGTFFAVENSMGTYNLNRSDRHQQSQSNILSFFSRLGTYNVYNLIPTRKKMAAIVIKFSIFLANLFGVSLFVYWLAIDFAGIKIFITSVGVFIYGGMKLYEKYLDIKAKKRDQNDYDKKHIHHNKK